MSLTMLKKYLDRLGHVTYSGSRIWLDAEGRVQGRFVNATLTSAFQPIREIGSERVCGFEGFIRSYSDTDHGLSPWRLLEQAATDSESIELDRLCRILHAINFFRQPQIEDADLYLSVDGRLLAAVDSNHGTAFRRVLSMLELPHQRVVLQLPAVVHDQNWLLNYVSDNYRRNGFRLAVNANTIQEAEVLLDHVRPDVIKLDVRGAIQLEGGLHLLQEAAKRGIKIVFKRVENALTLEALTRLGQLSGQNILAQGFLWDLPGAKLRRETKAQVLLTALPVEHRNVA